jgi:hypothetical protein
MMRMRSLSFALLDLPGGLSLVRAADGWTCGWTCDLYSRGMKDGDARRATANLFWGLGGRI